MTSEILSIKMQEIRKRKTALVILPVLLRYPTAPAKILICPHCGKEYDLTVEEQIISSYDDFKTVAEGIPFLPPPECYEIGQHICGGMVRFVPA